MADGDYFYMAIYSLFRPSNAPIPSISITINDRSRLDRPRFFLLRDHWRVIPANSSRQEKWLEVIEALQANMSGALDSMRKVHCHQVR